MSRFILDTNIFNRILDTGIRGPFNSGVELFATHIELDELRNTRNFERRKNLLDVFQEIGSKQIPTESAVWGVSKWGHAKWTSVINLYTSVLNALNAKNGGKRNNMHDALIAETAIRNNLTLVTEDRDLADVTTDHRGTSINLSSFMETLSIVFRERAEERVKNYPALSEFRYVLIDDPLLVGPPRFEFTYNDEDQTKLEEHYRWVSTADRFELLEWAADAAREYREFLVETLKDTRSQVRELLKKNPAGARGRDLREIERTLQSAERTLDHDLQTGAGFLLQGIRALERYCYNYHDERLLREHFELLAVIVERIRAGAQKGHTARYGTPEDKARTRAAYQAYVDKIHAECPLMSITHVRALTAKHFNVSLRTIEKYTKNG